MDTVQKLKLVYGYIRIEFSFLQIPSDIINEVGRFLSFADKWNQSYTSDTITINEEDNSMTIKDTARHSTLCIAYGNAVIDKTSGVYSWKLRIIDSKERKHVLWFMVIGIARDDHEMLSQSTTFFSRRWDAQRHSKGFVTGHAKKKCLDNEMNIKRSVYGKENQFSTKGDKLEMILNMKDGTLRYIVNDEDYGVAFDNIDTTQKYRLAIRVCYNARDCVFQLY